MRTNSTSGARDMIRDASNIAIGALAGALAVWLYLHPATPPESGTVVDSSRIRCGCPAVNTRGEPFAHCMRGYADGKQVQVTCGYKAK